MNGNLHTLLLIVSSVIMSCAVINYAANIFINTADKLPMDYSDIVDIESLDRLKRILEDGVNSTSLILAKIEINPVTLNLRSRGKWITVYIELPTGYLASHIDISSILLNNTIPVDIRASTTIGDYDGDGIQDLMVKFDRALVSNLLSVGEATLIITGEIEGIPFIGIDTITVKD
jgi:hypothetical protein